jgi:hypothetical protein
MRLPHPSLAWAETLPVAVTVADAKGTILFMNACARAKEPRDLIGSDLFACHPGASRDKLAELYRTHKSNHYTIEKKGIKKVIHQMPWFHDDQSFAGFVEISVPIPETLPHFIRQGG